MSDPEKPAIDPSIQGWCDFQNYLWRIANVLPDGSLLVELGPWLGLSTIFLAESLARLKKINCTIWAIDTWKGSPSEQAVFDYVIAGGTGTAFERFTENIQKHKVDFLIESVVSDSVEAADGFTDESVDFVFFDTEHTEERLTAELKAWIPKLKPGAWFGGHDIAVPGVRSAVEKNVKHWHVDGPCWEAKNE